MPLYTVSTRVALPEARRAALAKFITDTHCDETGAPPTFVNVMFWTGVPLPSGCDIHLFGSVRGGRSAQTKAALKRRLTEGLGRIAAVDLERIGYRTFDVPARMVMEGGVVLPEPGEEQAWLREQGRHEGAVEE